MPPPPDRIHYASPASQVPASSHVPTVLQDNQAPKAPPPKPPSSSEDEWPSEGEAPPEEDDTTMVQLGLSTCGGPSTPTSTSSTTTPRADNSRGSRSRSPDRGAGPAGEPTNPASSSSTGRSSRTYRHHLEIDDGFEKKNSLQEVSYQGGELEKTHHARQQSQPEGGN
ncbi:unnamed protein product [Symbiodinium microadriaticum]|nr:unnamed protein product [Symbiodinium microadriaticum]